jgi:hypothetical protein
MLVPLNWNSEVVCMRGRILAVGIAAYCHLLQ